MPKRGPSVAACVLELLAAHPHQDTPEAIAGRRPGTLTTAGVAEALAALRESGLVHTADGHWQLTPAGFRAQREPSRLAG